MGNGAWEQDKREVLIGILTREVIHIQWAISFKNLILPQTAGWTTISGMPFDHGRNLCAQRCLENNFEYLMFLDDDVIVPPDAYVKLLAHKADIISGLYMRRTEPICPVMMRVQPNGQASWVANFPVGETIEVDYVGAGCLLIHRRVLEKMQKPWFEWACGREDFQPSHRTSEDYYFCRKAKELGFRVQVDTSIQCTHIGYGQSALNTGFSPVRIG